MLSMSISDMPDIYYLDEPRVNQQMQMIHQGQVQEVVETVSSTEEPSEDEGPNSLYKFLDHNRGGTTESIEDFTRTVQSTPVGLFITFHGVLDKQKGNLIHLSQIDNSTRNSLEDNDYISFKGKIEKPPWTHIYDLTERFGIDINKISSDNDELSDSSEEKLQEELEDAARYYQIPMNGECDGNFVFKCGKKIYRR